MIHSGTKTIQTLKLIRPSTLPMNRIGVIAANTNWKYSTDAPGRCQGGTAALTNGMLAWPCSAAAPRIVRGSPMNVLTSGVPKPSLNPHSTQATKTRPKVVNTIITVFIAHFFCTRPP